MSSATRMICNALLVAFGHTMEGRATRSTFTCATVGFLFINRILNAVIYLRLLVPVCPQHTVVCIVRINMFSKIFGATCDLPSTPRHQCSTCTASFACCILCGRDVKRINNKLWALAVRTDSKMDQ